MSLTNPNKIVTEERLSEFYGQILPYMGGMPDVLANKFSRSDIYSTEEKMIGVWTDSKPLYQKIVTTGGSVPSGATLIFRQAMTGYDAILYTKTTDSAVSIGDESDYSTTEKIVGTWIDGKPIYQKTFVNLSLPSTLATNVDTFVNAPQIIRRYSSGSDAIVTHCGVNTSNDLLFNLNSNTLDIATESSNYSGGTVNLTIQYTKTTD